MSQSKRLRVSDPSEEKDAPESELLFEGKRKKPSSEEKKLSDSGSKEIDPFEEEDRKMLGAAYSPSLFRKNTGFFADSSTVKRFPASLWQHCLTPAAATEHGQSIFKASSWRPLTEEEKRERGFYNHTDVFTTLEDREKLLQSLKALSVDSIAIQQKYKENPEASDSCRTPYSDCAPCLSCGDVPKPIVSSLPQGALEEHRQAFVPIWIDYKRQIRQSNCFDVDVHPGPDFGAAVIPLIPNREFERNSGKLRELAEIAIKEYNKKDCNVDKYEFKTTEKVVSALFGTYDNYWMTIRVLNLTNKTSIETFQIHAYLQSWRGEKTIVCCRPKGEAVDVGLPSCDFCFGKVRKSNVVGLKEA